jgi:hypothetical protein
MHYVRIPFDIPQLSSVGYGDAIQGRSASIHR